MKLQQGFSGLVVSTSAIIVAFAQPVWAAQTEVTNVQLQTSQDGITLVLNTQGNNRPPIFTVSRGRSTVVDIDDTQLRLTGTRGFEQANPVPGITSVTVQQFDADTVRVTVNGAAQAPAAQVIRQDGSERLGLSFKLVESLSESPAVPVPLPPPTGQRPNAIPPFRPRAIAPPVGDIAVAPLDVSPDQIRLNTDTIIPRLLLREAPVREVLTLLGRAANVNIAFAEGEAAGAAAQNGAAATTGGPTISLDIENESVQDVFNYVLRLANLEANRVGNTVFVSPNLPDTARSLVTRSLRLNQVTASTAANFLASRGADFQLPFEELTIVTVGEGASARTIEIREPEIKLVQPDFDESIGPLPLRGLSVSIDDRLDIITLVGSPRKVQIASSFLTQLDARRRQVAVNVKFIDVNLLKQKNSNADLQFGSGLGSGQSVVANFLGGSFQIGSGLGRDFLLNIIGAINDQDAKILTNPTLIVQEASEANALLSQGSGSVRLNVRVSKIDDNGFVTLRIQPEVSSLSGIRRIDTGIVRLRDGQTLILAGIIQDEDRVDVSKVPILGDIPILGRLFRRESKTRERRELVVVVTPKILDDSEQSSFGYEYTPSPEVENLLNR